MKEYLHYTVEELSLDKDFINWVRFGTNDDYWTGLLFAFPRKAAHIAEARKIVESFQPIEIPLSEVMVEVEVSTLMNAITTEEFISKPVRRRTGRWLLLTALAAAAILVFVITIYVPVLNNSGESYSARTAQRKLVEHFNSSDSAVLFKLPDGSTIKLSPGSRFSYSARFNDSANRDVFLSGEAAFDVAKNPRKPFRVFSNEIVTKVLGTSFIIRSFDNEDDINVSVLTGKVNVFKEGENGVLLTANQQAVYHKDRKHMTKKLNEKPIIISPAISNTKMVFEEVPVTRILTLLKEAYGISISYDSSILSSCTITADLSDESIYKKLDLVCRAINAEYEVIDSEVFITAKGCN